MASLVPTHETTRFVEGSDAFPLVCLAPDWFSAYKAEVKLVSAEEWLAISLWQLWLWGAGKAPGKSGNGRDGREGCCETQSHPW